MSCSVKTKIQIHVQCVLRKLIEQIQLAQIIWKNTVLPLVNTWSPGPLCLLKVNVVVWQNKISC